MADDLEQQQQRYTKMRTMNQEMRAEMDVLNSSLITARDKETVSWVTQDSSYI